MTDEPTTDVARRWRDRVWLYRPGTWLPGWRIVQWGGGDEYDWHTLVIGSRLTGAVVVARKPCPGTGRCTDMGDDRDYPPAQTDSKEVGRG